jgi:hypothetical protein
MNITSSGLLRCVIRCVVSDVSKDRGAVSSGSYSWIPPVFKQLLVYFNTDATDPASSADISWCLILILYEALILMSAARESRQVKRVLQWGLTVLQWPVNLTVIWPFLLGASELMHSFIFKGRTSLIMLKISDATIENVARAVRRPEFVHPCSGTIQTKILWTQSTSDSGS